MSVVGLRGFVLLVALALAAARVVSAFRMPVSVDEPDTPPSRRATPTRDSLSRLTDRAARRSPFRFVAAIEAPPISLTETDPDPPVVGLSIPEIRIKAIVGGPPWSAVLVGIPGMAGDAVVRPGDAFADLIIVTLNPDSAVLRWSDSTWTIRLGRSTP